jgi:catechol 2,3-dioxygenase-like lactoylglutathione lyase family enzyme
MAQSDVTIPTFPARNLDETIEFYSPFGFKVVYRHPDPEGYVILRFGTFEIHFFLWPGLKPEDNYAGCYMRVSDVDAVYRAFSSARLPARGIPCMGGIEKKFYRMREFRLLDPNGNLLRIGEEEKSPAARPKRVFAK